MANYQQKQEITPSLIQDLVGDLRSGLSEEEIARKYGLALPQPSSKSGEEDLQPEYHESSPYSSSGQTSQPSVDQTDRETEESGFICPTCLTAFAVMFDICPNCSASVQESIGGCEDQPAPEIASAAQAARNPAEQAESTPWTGQAKDRSVHQQTSEESFVVPPDEIQPQAIPVGATSPGTKCGDKGTAATLKTSSQQHLRNRSSKPSLTGGKLHRAERLRGLHSTPSLRCESCESAMTPALRDIYDRSRGLQSLIAASVFFLLSYVCCILLSFLDTPSVPRLTVFFSGCLCLMLGCVFTAVGAFMYLAREKVYFCTRCKRTYPRADISYLAAALVWSSKRAGGSL